MDNNQAILVLSYIDYQKSYISVCDKKSAVIHYVIIEILMYILMMKWDI